MEATVYDKEQAIELWRKMTEILTSGKTTGEIIDEFERLCPEFKEGDQECRAGMRKRMV